MANDDGREGGRRKSRNTERSDDGEWEENSYEEEPDFSDSDDFEDDVTDEEMLGDLLKKKPKETDGIDSVVVVDNIPSVNAVRLEKLQNVIRKIFNKFGKITNELYPKKENGDTKGYIFLEFSNPHEANEAVKATNGYKLDKAHTFVVNLFSDFDKYGTVPDEWEVPQPSEYKDPGNLKHFLTDEHCFDQFSVIYEGGDKTAIFQNTPDEPQLLEERSRWTETYVRWSPQGTYLATFHQKGIALWGGEHFKQIMRFSHTGVQLIDFSPCEKYMVTFSPMPDNKEDPQAIIIWDIRTGVKKRGFHCENSSMWPIFKWNFDGQYFARMTPDTLSIYETPSFGLLDKKSIKVANIRDFSWSPTDNIICYWKPEEGDSPARVCLIKLPTREQISVKNLFTVKDCKLHWQKSGDYLCVKVDRYRKRIEEKGEVKYMGIYHNFNIFRIREKHIPVDIVEHKEAILAFAWEPVGHKFAFIHGEVPRINVSFYTVNKNGSIDLVKTLEKRQTNFLFWSPNGQHIVLAGLRSMSGILEFVDTSDMTIMCQSEHFMATDVEWDPTGRYVATGVSWWGHKVDNAFWIWNFQGKLLHKAPLERFCQLLWHPRPASLLAKEQVRDIKKNMKKYSSRFVVEDKMRESKASKEQIEKRRTMLEDHARWLEEMALCFEEEKEQRMALRDGVDTDGMRAEVDNLEEETVEFLLKVEETVIEE